MQELNLEPFFPTLDELYLGQDLCDDFWKNRESRTKSPSVICCNFVMFS